MPFRKLIPPFTFTGWGGGVVQYIKKCKNSDLRHKATAKEKKNNRLLHISIFIFFYYFLASFKEKTSKVIFPSAFYHPHFIIRILSSAFYYPHFIIRHPPSAIRRHPVRILQRPVVNGKQVTRNCSPVTKHGKPGHRVSALHCAYIFWKQYPTEYPKGRTCFHFDTDPNLLMTLIPDLYIYHLPNRRWCSMFSKKIMHAWGLEKLLNARVHYYFQPCIIKK